MTPAWYQVLRGGHAYNEGPEQETRWVRDSFCMGLLLGLAIACVGIWAVS